MFNCTVPGASAAISAATHGGFHQLSSQSPSPVFLCLKSRYLSFVYNQKSQSSWSAMHSSHPRQECYHKDRESHTDLVHQHIASTYLLQPTTTILPAQRTWKNFCQQLHHGRITTKREQQDWHQQLMWILRIEVQLPSLICDPTITKDPKRTHATVSFSDLQGLQKNMCSNHVVWWHRSHIEVLRLAQKVSNFSIFFWRFSGQNL